MKAAALVLSAAFAVASAAPAHAQLGALGKIKKGVDDANKAKKTVDDINITDAEERQIGEAVSMKLRERFGVMQDREVTKYVTLVGTVVAQQSSRPALDWKFIVLDTDGVNAYATPGGFVHITRGLLGMMKNESELAGVLGHEITHIADKHTVKQIRDTKMADTGVDLATSKSGYTTEVVAKLSNKMAQKFIDGAWSRTDEDDADKVGIRDANKAGYAPNGLATALQKLDDRNPSDSTRNGWFASHPDTKDRIANVNKQIAAEKLKSKAVVEARYKQHITFDAKPLSEITAVDAGASGLASGNKKEDDKNAPKPDSKKGGTGSISKGTQQAQAGQQTASAGARGVGKDSYAKGGSNPAIVAVSVTPQEITAFKKGIA